MPKSQDPQFIENKSKIVDLYAFLVSQGVMYPTRRDLFDHGVNRDRLRYYFVNLSNLREAAKKAHPGVFAGVMTEAEMLSPKRIAEINKQIKKTKRFVVTTAVAGQPANTKFLDTLDAYCAGNDAMLLILPAYDPSAGSMNNFEWHFDKEVAKRTVLFHQTALNTNIHISSLRISARQVNPTTGLGRISQGKGSFVFASPKQTLEFDPVSNVKYPHARMSTGACTSPQYTAKAYGANKNTFVAENDHVIGALVIEVENDKIYHFRQIQSDQNGGFCDLGVYYCQKKKQKVIPKLSMGDLHAGQHDESACAAWEEIIDQLSVDEIFFHDAFNGRSINHHEEEDIITRTKLSKENLLNLEQELKVTGDVLNRFLSKKSVKRGVITKSNHDEWLIRWLKRGRFSRDPLNFQAGCRLSDAAVEGRDPLEEGLKIYSKMSKQSWDKLKFLKRDEDYKVAGIECGAHGDKGPNGAPGSKNNLEAAYGKCVVGHSHTPGILRGVFQIGTSSLLKMGYNDGASSWMHCSCLIYPNGQRQLINSIGGKWRLKKNK